MRRSPRLAAASFLRRTTRFYASCGRRVSDLSGIVATIFAQRKKVLSPNRQDKHGCSPGVGGFGVWCLRERPAYPPQHRQNQNRLRQSGPARLRKQPWHTEPLQMLWILLCTSSRVRMCNGQTGRQGGSPRCHESARGVSGIEKGPVCQGQDRPGGPPGYARSPGRRRDTCKKPESRPGSRSSLRAERSRRWRLTTHGGTFVGIQPRTGRIIDFADFRTVAVPEHRTPKWTGPICAARLAPHSRQASCGAGEASTLPFRPCFRSAAACRRKGPDIGKAGESAGDAHGFGPRPAARCPRRRAVESAGGRYDARHPTRRRHCEGPKAPRPRAGGGGV